MQSKTYKHAKQFATDEFKLLEKEQLKKNSRRNW